MKTNRRMILSIFWVALGAALLGSNLAGLLGDYWGGLGGGLLGVGVFQIIRNVRVKADSITLTNLHVDTTKTYTFTDVLGKRSFVVSGADLADEGFCDRLEPRSGVIWFYTKA